MLLVYRTVYNQFFFSLQAAHPHVVGASKRAHCLKTQSLYQWHVKPVATTCFLRFNLLIFRYPAQTALFS